MDLSTYVDSKYQFIIEIFNSLQYDFWKFQILFSILLLFFSLYLYKIYFFTYWSEHNIPHETPSIISIFGCHVPNILGNIPLSFLFGFKNMDMMLTESYNKFNDNQFHGLYMLGRPFLVINDPKLIRLILVRDFKNFSDRGWFVNDAIDPMSNNLFLQPHDKWVKLRTKFSMMFTPAKIRNMCPLFINVCDNMIHVCNSMLNTSNVLEVGDIMERYAIDIISFVIYGANASCLLDKDNGFRNKGIEVFKLGNIKFLFGAFFPEILKFSGRPLYSKNVREFFMEQLENAITKRLETPSDRRDFIDLFIELKKEYNQTKNSSNQGENDNETFDMTAAAQALVFFLAGFETTASSTTFCLYELALNRDIQVKLQSEIDRIAENEGGLNYENVANSDYLDRVISETLRKHAVAPFLTRMCLNNYQIPRSNYIIPKGMRLIFPTSGIQSNPEFYSNPDLFDPDRFLRRNNNDINKYRYLVFGEGPRNCIGKKFGLLEIKQVVARFVYNYSFWISDQMTLPLKCNPNNFMHVPGQGVYLRILRRR